MQIENAKGAKYVFTGDDTTTEPELFQVMLALLVISKEVWLCITGRGDNKICIQFRFFKPSKSTIQPHISSHADVCMYESVSIASH
jgi:hypothetical protein